ncbi:hypothetical protein DMH15_02870 [Streptomyces sp. WAC 06725]|nr:hypothetical protein DMH15_02870 [Streptomyces sp. WAC 06725]
MHQRIGGQPQQELALAGQLLDRLPGGERVGAWAGRSAACQYDQRQPVPTLGLETGRSIVVR